MKDEDTLNFYAREAAAYAARGTPALSVWLDRFLERVTKGGRILELGCGAGQDSAAMLAAGYDVMPTDGTPELAQEAEQRLGRPVRVMTFDALDYDSQFDGVWANACLLHVPRADLASILKRVGYALKPGGVLYASFKAGEAEGRDSLGRYYNYPDAALLRGMFDAPSWQSTDIYPAQGSGYDRQPTAWLHVLAVKA